MKKTISGIISAIILILVTISIVPFALAAEQTLPRKFQDFETYNNNNELNNFNRSKDNYSMGYYLNDAGGNVLFELDAQNKFSGKYGLKFAYDVSASGGKGDYCGRELFMPAIQPANDMLFNDDWTGAQAIQFWLKGDTSKNTLVIQFDTDDGETWNFGMLLTDDKAQIVRIRFRDMKSRNGSPSIRYNKITKTSIYVNKTRDGNTGIKDKGTIYLDDFQLVKSSDPVPELPKESVSTASGTSSAVGASSMVENTNSTQNTSSKNTSTQSNNSTVSDNQQSTVDGIDIGNEDNGEGLFASDNSPALSSVSSTPESKTAGGVSLPVILGIVGGIAVIAGVAVCVYIFVIKAKKS